MTLLAVRRLLAPCRCGYEWPAEDLADVSTFGDVETQYVPTRPCATPGCAPWCPTCHRPAGDIHSGACSSFVLAALEDPCRVARKDCI